MQGAGVITPPTALQLNSGLWGPAGPSTEGRGVPEHAVLIGGRMSPQSPPRLNLRTASGSEAAPWPRSPAHDAHLHPGPHLNSEEGSAQVAATCLEMAATVYSPGRAARVPADREGAFSGKPRPSGAISPRSFYRPTALTSLPAGPAAGHDVVRAASPTEPLTPDTQAPLAATRKGALPVISGETVDCSIPPWPSSCRPEPAEQCRVCASCAVFQPGMCWLLVSSGRITVALVAWQT